MKFTVQTLRPRNPLALAARRRRAGSHRRTEAALRRAAARELKREVDRLKPRR